MHTKTLDMAVGHLNAAVGPVVKAHHLGGALRAGTTASIASTSAAALVGSIFSELSAELILRCAEEAGGTLAQANALYQETIGDGFPRSTTWEKQVEHLL
jgi:hypothetical protein